MPTLDETSYFAILKTLKAKLNSVQSLAVAWEEQIFYFAGT